jgi:anti-sigma-K factor RskA
MTGRVLQLDLAAHKVADVLLPWFVNGTLEGDERAFVEQHVSRCGRCQREVEWLRGLHAACIAGEAAPGAAPALRNLRRRLEEPPRGRGPVSSLRQLWSRARPWSRWLIAAELAAVVALGAWLLPAADGPALYRTLGAGTGSVATSGNIVVVFDPTTPEADLRRILRQAGARIVDGPTQANAYVLDVPGRRQEQALQALRAERATVLVEPLAPQGVH